MRVLIVSYYHRSTDVGGRRWRMFAERMKQDYDVTVLCPEKPRLKRNYPYIVRFLVSHLFYPDYRKAFAHKARRHLTHNRYDLVITSYPPLSMLQIGRFAASQGMKWILDMRDPFVMYNNKWAGNTPVSNFIRMFFVVWYIKKTSKIIFVNRELMLSVYNTLRNWLRFEDVYVISNCHE